MSILNDIHQNYVFKRRVRVLSSKIAALIPEKCDVLDVGCGDGLIDKLILDNRKDIHIEGIDVLIRPTTFIGVRKFDGIKIPFPDNSFNCVMFIDVLHHTENPSILVKEAARVTKKWIIIKDHIKTGLIGEKILKIMDWVGNARHGVVLPYNYLTAKEWEDLFSGVGLRVANSDFKLGLYPFPANLVFEKGLHFLSLLEKLG
jgi:SAM-dependent methyltransferase